MTKLRAKLLDGTVVDETKFPSIINFPLDQVVELTVCSENTGIPPVLIKVNPLGGERVHRFTRVAMSLTGAPTSRVEIYEIQKEGKMVCRLYWHPEHGPILSTQDLHF